MPNHPVIIFAGGGTGGHLFPGIAVAEALRETVPGARPLFLCTLRDIDQVILKPTGFEFIPQPIIPPLRSVGGLLRFWKSWRETKDLVRQTLDERQPAAVVGLGGYAAGVAVKLAALKKIPTALINPDVVPGKANQYLIQYAGAICAQFEATRGYLNSSSKAKLQVTGCPIRSDMLQLLPRAQSADRLGLDPLLSTLVVTGASLGAQTVNEAVVEMVAGMTLSGWQILHISGREHAESVRAGYRQVSVQAQVIEFTPAMADVWSVAGLAISRSGASSCAELTACGVPSILMPYPFHRDMHQRLNAQVLEQAGAAVLIDDEKDRRRNAEKLRPLVQSLLYDGPRRQKMAGAARQLGKPQAAAAVAEVITRMIESNR